MASILSQPQCVKRIDECHSALPPTYLYHAFSGVPRTHCGHQPISQNMSSFEEYSHHNYCMCDQHTLHPFLILIHHGAVHFLVVYIISPILINYWEWHQSWLDFYLGVYFGMWNWSWFFYYMLLLMGPPMGQVGCCMTETAQFIWIHYYIPYLWEIIYGLNQL